MKQIESKFTVDGNNAVYSLKDVATGESRSFTLDLSAIAARPEQALRALAQGVRIRCREATGGKSFEQAVGLLEDFAASINSGFYPVRQREAGETRSSPLIRALAAVFHNGDVSAAQAEYERVLSDEAAAAGVDLDADDEAGVAAARKLKRQVQKTLSGHKAVAAALESLKLEAAREALRRAEERAEAARRAAEAVR